MCHCNLFYFFHYLLFLWFTSVVFELSSFLVLVNQVLHRFWWSLIHNPLRISLSYQSTKDWSASPANAAGSSADAVGPFRVPSIIEWDSPGWRQVWFRTPGYFNECNDWELLFQPRHSWWNLGLGEEGQVLFFRVEWPWLSRSRPNYRTWGCL
jgi:hypothetical protein